MNKKYLIIAGLVATSVAIAAAAVFPAFALNGRLGLGVDVNATTSVSSSMADIKIGVAAGATLSARIGDITNRADQEIARRVSALTALSTRVNAMVRLSATEKSGFSSTIQSQINALNALKTQIATDAAANSTTSLKADVKSIVTSYRIFVLIMPQGVIEAAAGRVSTIVGILNDLSAKFAARIDTAKAAGNDVTVAASALTDFNAKVIDANTQAQAAASEVASLTPDNGDATIAASNRAALQDARTKLVTAQHDLASARADAGAIVSALAKFKVSANANTNAGVSASSSASSSAH
jgi:hypothetical protein